MYSPSRSSACRLQHVTQDRELRWHAARALRHHIPQALRHWLFDRQSLTQKLIDHTAGNFQVKVLQESLQRPRLSEARLLNLCPRRLARVREVHLCHGEQPLVYARTIIPLAALKGEFRQLRALGNRSLGSALFVSPHIRRGAMQVSRADHGWARRSTFHRGKSAVLVTELFLQSIHAGKPEHP